MVFCSSTFIKKHYYYLLYTILELISSILSYKKRLQLLAVRSFKDTVGFDTENIAENFVIARIFLSAVDRKFNSLEIM